MKNMNIVIGLCGGRLSGKDTVAEFIQEIYHDDVWICSLADPIKEQYARIMNLDKSILYKQGKTKEQHRIGLITLGAVRRSDNINWWCEALHGTHENENVIIPDIRYANELDYYKKHSNLFILIEVSSLPEVLVSRGWKSSIADETTSESEHLGFVKQANYLIKNNGTKENLKKKVKKIYNKFQKYTNFSLEYEWGSGKFPTYSNTR